MHDTAKELEDGPATLHKPAVRRCIVVTAHRTILVPERLIQHSRLEVAGQLNTCLVFFKAPGKWQAPHQMTFAERQWQSKNIKTPTELSPPAMAPPSIENAVRGPMIIPCPT